MSDKKTKHIVQIVAFAEGGAGVHTAQLCRALTGRYRVSLVTNIRHCDRRFLECYQTFTDDLFSMTPIYAKKRPSKEDIAIVIRLFRVYKKQNVDIVHGHGAKGGLYARILGKLLGAKVVYTPHGGSMHDMYGKLTGKVYIGIEKLLYYWSDLILFESRYSLRQYTKKVHPLSQKLRVNYNGVAIDNEAKYKDFTLHERIEIASFGMLRRLKGHDILIRAAKRLKDQGYTFKVSIYGEGEEHDNLEKLIQRLGLEKHVFLCGFTSDVETAMRRSHIVVHPSRYEALPYVPIEAMNQMTPVIVSNVGGMEEIVTDRFDGLVFPNERVDALVSCLCFMIEQNEARKAMVYRAKKTVKEKFDLQKNIEKLYSFYETLV